MHHFDSIRRRPLFVDVPFAVLLGAMAITIALTAPRDGDVDEVQRPDHLVRWALLLTPAAAVAFRRSAPVRAMAVGVAATMAIWLSGMPDYTFACGVLLYSAAVYGRPPGGTRAAIAGAVTVTGFAILGAIMGEAPPYVVPLVALITFGGTMLGINLSTRAAYTAEVEQRAALAEQHRTVSEEALLQAERNRMARELHDVVAHGLGVIVVQASAGRRIIGSDLEGARDVLGRIEHVGRSSLAEMRQLLGVLRTEPQERLRPTPGVASLDELVDGFRSSGLSVELVEDGDRPELSSSVETAVYRIIQEGLTNVLKHGGPNVRTVATIAFLDTEIDVRIVDNGRGGSALPGRGHGLVGMRERVDVFGGTLRAGPRSGGGFEVAATLPLETASVA